jgi:3-oxoacyl-[acyl-carrier protein] reductase
VTINNLLPGSILTDRIAQTVVAAAKRSGRSEEEELEARRKDIPAGRFGSAEEFGEACAFLCSAQMGYVTGQHFLMDGGLYPGTF